jgi:hypothetical protein
MKPYYLNLLFFLLPIIVDAQTNEYSRGIVDVGINTINKEPIKGLQYDFGYYIYKYSLNKKDENLLITLRKVKNNRYKLDNAITLLDLKTNEIKWYEKNKGFTSITMQDRFLVREHDKICCYKKENDELLWKNTIFKTVLSTDYYIVHSEKEIARIDTATGKLLWNRKINLENGVNSVFYLNDSIVILVSKGFHCINIQTGAGWDYEARTEKSDYGRMVGTVAAGVALGLLTGAYVVPNGPDIVTHLNSDVIHENGLFYFATAEDLVCLNSKGDTVWTKGFDKNTLSLSRLYNKNNTLLLFNTGYGYLHNKRVKFGKAFLEAYNKSNGRFIYHKDIDTKDISDYFFTLDNLIYIGDNKINLYNLQEGKYKSYVYREPQIISKQPKGDDVYNENNENEQETNEQPIENGKSFLIKSDIVYTQLADSSFKSITQLYPGRSMIANNNEVLCFDPNNDKKDVIKTKALFLFEYNYGGLYFLKDISRLKMLVIKGDKKIAELDYGNTAFFSQGNFYSISGSKINIVTLTDLN